MILQQPNVTISSQQKKIFNRIAINIFMDGLLAAIAAPLARWLSDPQGGFIHPLWFLTGGVLTLLVSGIPFHIPQQYWRFSGIADLLNIAAASVGSAILFTCLLYVTGYPLPSVTFPFIYAMVLLLLMGGGRIGYRILSSEAFRNYFNKKRKIIIVGNDADIDLFMRAIRLDHSNVLSVMGLISFRQNRKGHRIHNIPILGSLDDFSVILTQLDAQKKLPSLFVIIGQELRGEQLRDFLAIAGKWNIDVQRTPVITHLSPAANLELKPIALDELLNRPQIVLDRAGMAEMIKGKVVAITGAGGSIGSELVRQVADLSPKLLLLLDQSEYALWKINIELSESNFAGLRETILINIREKKRVDSLFQKYKPDLVFHAAALKHVFTIENNPIEGFLTNIIGTRVVADAAVKCGTQAFIMISTDKAVNPSSFMGVSKRIAEMYCQSLDKTIRDHDPEKKNQGFEWLGMSKMRFITVRFGNVLGSTGSVVPLFKRQLSHGGPLTVTDPNMQRYFMTIPEAVGLVLQASVRATIRFGNGDKTDEMLHQGGIFVLDMGKPIKILDLARQMIRLAGLKPDEDIVIEFTGAKPGEKLFEELFYGREAPVPTDHNGLLMATPKGMDIKVVTEYIDRIRYACDNNDVVEAITYVQKLVPEFKHLSN